MMLGQFKMEICRQWGRGHQILGTLQGGDRRPRHAEIFFLVTRNFRAISGPLLGRQRRSFQGMPSDCQESSKYQWVVPMPILGRSFPIRIARRLHNFWSIFFPALGG